MCHRPWGRKESDTILASEQQQLLHAPGGAERQGDMPQSQPTLSCLSYGLTPQCHPRLPSPRIGPAPGDFIVGEGRALWAAVYGVSQSQTRLKRLSSCSSNRTVLGRSSLGANLLGADTAARSEVSCSGSPLGHLLPLAPLETALRFRS